MVSVFVVERHVGGVFLGYPAVGEIFVQISPASRPRYCRVPQQQLVRPVQVEVMYPPEPASRYECGGVVPVEECRHISGVLLSHVGDGGDDVRRHIRGYHSQEDQLVAVVVPEGRLGVVSEVGLSYIPGHVGIFPVDIAPETWPEERPVQTGVEDTLLPFRTACHPYFRKQVFPCAVRFLAYGPEIFLEHLGLEVYAGVFCTYKGESYLELQRFGAFTVLECDDRHGVAVFPFLSGLLSDSVNLIV